MWEGSRVRARDGMLLRGIIFRDGFRGCSFRFDGGVFVCGKGVSIVSALLHSKLGLGILHGMM